MFGRAWVWSGVFAALLASQAQARPAKKKTEEAPAARPQPAPVVRREPARPAPGRGSFVVREEPAVVERGVTTTPPRAFITLAVGAHVDNVAVRGRERRSVLVTEERQDQRGSGLHVAAGFLLPRGDRLRLGAVARYAGNWEVTTDGMERPSTMGYLAGLSGRGEYVLPFQGRLDVLLGAEAGLLVLFPGGDLANEIAALQAQGAGVWDLPRIGYTAGPEAGFRYRISQRVGVRAGFGVAWSQLFLFFTHDDVQGIRFEKTRRLNVVRYDLGLSLEAAL